MINVALYSALCQVFGQRNVHIVKQGQRGNFVMGTRKRVVRGKVEDYRTICKKSPTGSTFVGEEFKIRCPFCKDHLPRLYINHLFGTKDRVTGQRYLWMANCYNSGCMTSFDNRKKLFDMLQARVVLGELASAGRVVDTDVPATWPGEVVSIYSLAKYAPKHPAVIFAHARGWDVQKLSEMFDVRVIIEPDMGAFLNAWLRNRIISPVYGGDGALKTWTARSVDDDGPKHFHCPHIGTGNTIYGLASAAKADIPAIVEGPGDTYTMDGDGAGMFGKVLQLEKAKRMAKAFADKKAIALILDPKQDWRDKKEGRLHQIEAAYKTMTELTDVPVIRVYLPEFTDPGGLDNDIVHYHIERSADEQRIKI